MGRGREVGIAAFREAPSVPADIGAHTSAGETDPQVARETFQVSSGATDDGEELDRLYAQYLLHMAEDIWLPRSTRSFLALSSLVRSAMPE